MDGLECSEILFSEICATLTLRIDSEYYKKKYLKIEHYINDNIEKFKKLQMLGVNVDASAFYPSLGPYYNTGTIPFIRVADVKTFIDYDNCIRIPLMDDNFSTLYLAHKGDIVLTKGGRVGTAGLITEDSYITRDLIFLNSSNLPEDDYISLYLLLCSDFMYKQMIRSSSMTAQPHLTITLIRELLVPALSKQFKSILAQEYKKVSNLKIQSQLKYKEAEEILYNSIKFSHTLPQNVCEKMFSTSFGATGRLDAEYYQPKYDEYLMHLQHFNTTSLPIEFDVFKNTGTNYADGISDVGVIKTKQLTNTGVNIDGVESYLTNEVCAQNKSTVVTNNDVIFATMGVGSLGKVSLFSYKGDKHFVTDSTLRIYRAKKSARILPEVLCVFLQSTVGQELIYRYVVGSTGIINIYDDDIAKIPIPILDMSIQKNISEQLQKSFLLQSQAKKLLEYTKRTVEMAIEQGEDKATAFLSSKIQNI